VPDRELSDELRELGHLLDAHPPDDLADRVITGLSAPPAGPSRWRTVAIAALVALVVAAGVVAVSPPVRAAIARFFFGGVTVHVGPSGAPTPVASPSLPGEHRTDVAGAGREVGFRVRLPAGLGAPTEVTVTEGRVVSLFYARPGGTVRIDEFAGDLGPVWDKYALVMAQAVTVGTDRALWFDSPVTVEYVDRDGDPIPGSARSTATTLIWIDGPLTFRLDGITSRAGAIALAETVR